MSQCDELQRCHCGRPLVMRYSAPQLKIFKPFITRNIREDGKPVEVRSEAHQAELCKVHGCRPSPLRDYYKDIAARKTVQGSVSEVKDRLKEARKIIREVPADEPEHQKLGQSFEPVRGSITPDMVMPDEA